MRVKWVVFVAFMVEEIPWGEQSSPLQKNVTNQIAVHYSSISTKPLVVSMYRASTSKSAVLGACSAAKATQVPQEELTRRGVGINLAVTPWFCKWVQKTRAS